MNRHDQRYSLGTKKCSQARVKTDKGIPKTMASTEKAKEMINERKKRHAKRLLDKRLKENADIFDTNATNPLKTTKRARSEANVIGKEKTGRHLECGNDGDTDSLVDDESVNDNLKQMKQLRKNKCRVHHGHDIEHMTISQEKKDEVSLLSGPSRSTIVSLEGSVLNELSPGVKSSWKDQTKVMARVFGWSVRDEFMKDYKFCNEKICRQVVTKCLARNAIVLTPGMSYVQFVDVTSKSPIVSKLFNNQRHHIQSKMRRVYIGKNLSDPGRSLALNDSLTMIH